MTATSWKEEELEHSLTTYSPKKFYNACETGIFFWTLPDSTYVLKKDSRQGQGLKKAENQIITFVISNMVGEKTLLLDIVKAKKPMVF